MIWVWPFVIGVTALLFAVAAVSDWRTRKHGGRLRSARDIGVDAMNNRMDVESMRSRFRPPPPE